MIGIFLPVFLIYSFGLLSLLGINQAYFYNQLAYLVAGLTVYFVVKKVGRRYFEINSYLFYWLLIVLLLVTFFVGLEVKGSRRWLTLYFFNLQSSEILKVLFIMFLSQFLAKKHIGVNKRVIFALSLMYFVIPFVIIFKQPDLGNALVYGAIFLVMVMLSDLPNRYLMNLGLTLVMFLPLGWLILKPYQKLRLLSFVSPHTDPQGVSYNMIQAVITIGSGKFFGRGLGLGTQSRFYFLPENHTDFAFASLVEQFGFFGGFIVLFLFAVMVYFMIKEFLKYVNSRDEENRSIFLFYAGFITYVVFQIIVNVGMNLGVLPVAGIALPLISYGGSAFMSFMIGLALFPDNRS